MKKCMALFLTAAMILTGTLVCACAEGDRPLDQQVEDRLHASIQHETDSPEWVGELAAQQDGPVTQLFVVAALGMDRTTATVSMHELDENGNWKQILSTPGYVGKYGLCLDEDHVEGCGHTTSTRPSALLPTRAALCRTPRSRMTSGGPATRNTTITR